MGKKPFPARRRFGGTGRNGGRCRFSCGSRPLFSRAPVRPTPCFKRRGRGPCPLGGCGKPGKGRTTDRAYRAPLQVGEILHEHLFSNLKSAVFTSATMAVGNNFTYFKERLGLDLLHPAERKELILESPFNFGRQVLLLVTGELPTPNNPAYTGEICRLLPGLLAASSGRALLLFTSRRQMQEVYTRLASALAQEIGRASCRERV